MLTAEELAQKFTARPQRRGRGFVVPCPIHGDDHPSLSIWTDPDGGIHATCHANQGCTEDAILDRVGLAWRDLRRGGVRESSHVFPYVTAEGVPAFAVHRTDQLNGKRDRIWMTAPDGTPGLPARYRGTGLRPLYRLPDLLARPHEAVLLVEGELKADRAAACGVLVSATSGGAGKAHLTDLSPLAGREVALWPDKDQPGLYHMSDVAERLLALNPAATIRWIDPPASLVEHGDVADWLAEGHAVEELYSLITEASPYAPGQAVAQADPPAVRGHHLTEPDTARNRGEARHLQSEGLIELVDVKALAFWHSPNGEPFVTVPVQDAHQHLLVTGKRFREWLAHAFHQREGRPPNAQALQDALRVLSGRALYEGGEHPLSVRVAGSLPEGELWIDLGDATGQAVHVTAEGWMLTTPSGVWFRRSPHMRALPIPEPGGSWEELRSFVNVADEEWPLLVAWLVMSFHPTGPYPVLVLQGEHGAAKSTTARILRSLVDPDDLELDSIPRSEDALMLRAAKSWAVVYDNMSGVPQWLSDALCRLATGGGIATRTLYTNTDETVLKVKRPIILTGIGDHIVHRGDLMDRTLALTLPSLADGNYRPESSFWPAWEARRPRVFGLVVEALVTALREWPSTRIESPRMADFARFVVAAEPALPWERGAFLPLYLAHRQDAAGTVLESSPVAQALLRFLRPRQSWRGTASNLLEMLKAEATEAEQRSKAWPSAPNALSNKLRQLAPALRTVAVLVSWTTTRDHHKARLIQIVNTRNGSPASPANPPSPYPDIALAQAIPLPADRPQPVGRSPAPPTVSDDADDGRVPGSSASEPATPVILPRLADDAAGSLHTFSVSKDPAEESVIPW